ncbi:MAG: AAA family ATPase, partial [Fusicatenibacter saccharivorans]|nr:AAA family ATPase [Fusicatenibacter saccharivorans]
MADYIQNLTIESFRGIHDLELKNLQPVNILTGDNNCGKTSVLEVIRSFTNPTDFRVWRAIIRKNFVASGTDISYFEGFYDLFDIDEERKSVSYRVTVENNAKIQQHQIILTADEVEKEMTETEYLEKLGIF